MSIPSTIYSKYHNPKLVKLEQPFQLDPVKNTLKNLDFIQSCEIRTTLLPIKLDQHKRKSKSR